MWRKHMKKPVRKVHRFLKRSFPQSRGGKGKGKRRYGLTEMQYDQIFFGGGGKSKGKRPTTGKGKGRRTNPVGADGEIMECSICQSKEHFRAVCPRKDGGGCGGCGAVLGHATNQCPAVNNYTTQPMDAQPLAEGPLADILFYNQVESTAFSRHEQRELADNYEPWPTPFHVPEIARQLP